MIRTYTEEARAEKRQAALVRLRASMAAASKEARATAAEGLDALAKAWAAETRPIARCRACGTPFVPKGRDGIVWTPDCGCAP